MIAARRAAMLLSRRRTRRLRATLRPRIAPAEPGLVDCFRKFFPFALVPQSFDAGTQRAGAARFRTHLRATLDTAGAKVKRTEMMNLSVLQFLVGAHRRSRYGTR